MKNKIIRIAKKYHADQRRKYTNEPYYNHLRNVAKLVKKHGGDNNQVYAALLHDILEDTSMTESELKKILIDKGLPLCDAIDVVGMVVDLTDVYTSDEYPHQNRKLRKIRENGRFSKVSERSKFIKCADLIDNTKSIVEHDPKFAKIYLKEKLSLLHSWSNPQIESSGLKSGETVKSIWLIAWLNCHFSLRDLIEEEEMAAWFDDMESMIHE